MLLSKIIPNVASMQPTNYAMKSSTMTITYEQLWQQVSRVAFGFQQLAIQPGHRIALIGNPTPYLAIAECAAMAIGAIPVTIFPGLAPIEIGQILQDAAPTAIVYDSIIPEISEVLSTLPITHSISCSSGYAPHSIEHFIANYPILTPWYEADPDDIALIIYTGGTTGRSKGVMHTHRKLRQWAFMNPELGGGHYPANKAIVPNQAHMTGQNILWTTLFCGGCLIYPDNFPLQVEEVIEIIEREQIKGLGTVGLLFRDIIHTKNIHSQGLQFIERITCGGAPFSEHTFHKAKEVLPNTQFVEVYSQTESGQFISFLSINQCFEENKLHRLRSVGNPQHMIKWGQQPFDVRIVDESGEDVTPGDVGEIICQSTQMMIGYWNNPDETNKALRNGWLYTGDLGRFDEDGYLYLLDRKKDMIIVGSSNVYCSEVENVLSKHPAIHEIAVIGTPLDEDGEEITAVVVMRPDSLITLEEITLFCHDQIASYKIPTRLEIVVSFPRTSVGKLNKAEVRKPFWSERTRMIN